MKPEGWQQVEQLYHSTLEKEVSARQAFLARACEGDEALLSGSGSWTHHRGQMTIYLRLMGRKVPSIYGSSADDNQFRS